ncbi:MAG: glycosyltransferase family 2 protein [Phycisphaerae bacterium]|nr:glycosyltransferase family 2 protein [Phycisphaerae bacterium]
MRVLVAIPAFNEDRHVVRVLSEVLRLADDLLAITDVLVVDDGSTDATAAILDRMSRVLVIRHPENRGYGRSLIDAFDFACRGGYDWVITMDCDGQHEPARLPAFIERAQQDDVDVISGSRYLVEMPGNTPPPEDRRQINAKIRHMLRQLLGLSLTDAFCGFKAYRVEALAWLSLSTGGYAFPLQFWVQAVRHGLRVCELPVRLIYNSAKRRFGGGLDDPELRLRHYAEALFNELARTAAPRVVPTRSVTVWAGATGSLPASACAPAPTRETARADKPPVAPRIGCRRKCHGPVSTSVEPIAVAGR